jgi:hypothetical protein
MQTTALRVAMIAAMLATVPAARADKKVKNPTDGYQSEVASVWFDKLYDVVKSERTAPPPASRIYGVVAVALYEAIVPGSLENRSLAGQLNGLTFVPQPKNNNKKYHWPTVANAVLARAIRGIFTSLTPEDVDAINALEASFNAQFQAQVKKNDFDESVEHGRAVADAILAWAATDGFLDFQQLPLPVRPCPRGLGADSAQLQSEHRAALLGTDSPTSPEFGCGLPAPRPPGFLDTDRLSLPRSCARSLQHEFDSHR